MHSTKQRTRSLAVSCRAGLSTHRSARIRTRDRCGRRWHTQNKSAFSQVSSPSGRSRRVRSRSVTMAAKTWRDSSMSSETARCGQRWKTRSASSRRTRNRYRLLLPCSNRTVAYRAKKCEVCCNRLGGLRAFALSVRWARTTTRKWKTANATT